MRSAISSYSIISRLPPPFITIAVATYTFLDQLFLVYVLLYNKAFYSPKMSCAAFM